MAKVRNRGRLKPYFQRQKAQDIRKASVAALSSGVVGYYDGGVVLDPGYPIDYIVVRHYAPKRKGGGKLSPRARRKMNEAQNPWIGGYRHSLRCRRSRSRWLKKQKARGTANGA